MRIQDVVNLLETEGELASPARIPNANARVSGVATIEAAGEGQVAWLSSRGLKENAHHGFQGALLLCPPEAEGVLADQAAASLRCRSPKWAFTLMVNRLFPELLTTSWPRHGEAPISAGAVIGANVHLGYGSVIGPNVRIGDDCRIGPNTFLANATLGPRVGIGANCTIGLDGFGYEKGPDGRFMRFPHIGSVEIESDVDIGSNSCIDRGALGVTRIGRGVKVDNLVHIAHNVSIGENSLIIAHAMLGGSAQLGSNVWLAPCASVINKGVLGDGVTVGMGAVVLKPVAAGLTVAGVPAKELPKRE